MPRALTIQPMAIAPQLDFAAFVAQKRNERANGALTENAHDYAYISDKQTRAAFERMRPVGARHRRLGAHVQNKCGGSEFARPLGEGFRAAISAHSRRSSSNAQTTLDIAMPSVYIVNQPTLNAATYGTNDDSFIMVHSALVDHFTDEELLTVIGHESAVTSTTHHVVYLTALHYLTRMAGTSS